MANIESPDLVRSTVQSDHRNDGSNNHQLNLALPYPQHHQGHYTAHTFRDFITPRSDAIIQVTGARQCLDTLRQALTTDVFAQRYAQGPELSPWMALIVALNRVCVSAGLDLISEPDLLQLLRAPWFMAFAKQAAQHHHIRNDLNLRNLDSAKVITEDHMVVVMEAVAKVYQLNEIGLGFVIVNKQGLKAFAYPWTALPSKLTAWIVADLRSGPPVFHGIGSQVVAKNVSVDEQSSDENDDDDDEDDNKDDEDDEMDEGENESDDDLGLSSAPASATAHAPSSAAVGSLPNLQASTPRKTNPAVLAQQVPLPPTLTAAQILQNHKSRLQYINILKVGLFYSNQQILAACKNSTLPKNEQLNGGTAVVKRLNTGMEWLEGQFGITAGALRTAYDRQRKANNVAIRDKEEVAEAVLTANATLIASAMNWIQTGGPRPSANTVINTNIAISAPGPNLVPHSGMMSAPVAPTVGLPSISSAGSAYAAPSAVPHGYMPASAIPYGYTPASSTPFNAQGLFATPYNINVSQTDIDADNMDLSDNNNHNHTQLNYNDDQMSEEEDMNLNHDPSRQTDEDWTFLRDQM
ncbi:hypothetical protein E4T43_04138 [Aureobasidium subglaciale]|nr:hypothetical protein E4T43_04138 [Aureobasidium subglaciale]